MHQGLLCRSFGPSARRPWGIGSGRRERHDSDPGRVGWCAPFGRCAWRPRPPRTGIRTPRLRAQVAQRLHTADRNHPLADAGDRTSRVDGRSASSRVSRLGVEGSRASPRQLTGEGPARKSERVLNRLRYSVAVLRRSGPRPPVPPDGETQANVWALCERYRIARPPPGAGSRRSCQIVFVTGDPGIGRTTTVEAFLADSRSSALPCCDPDGHAGSPAR